MAELAEHRVEPADDTGRTELLAELDRRLARLARLFDLDRVAEAAAGPRAIERYYRVCRHAYTRYHDRGNAVHMGLSDGPEFRPSDLTAQARIVERCLPDGARAVLELATGRGMNALWLARRHPRVTVHGIDLTEAQLDYAREDGRGVANFRVARGDFHDLSAFADASLDLVFVVEALCHSTDKGRVLAECARVLRPTGRLVVIDGYRGRSEADCTAAENRALRLLARGMAVAAFEDYRAFHRLAATGALRIVAEDDRTTQVMPSLRRAERLAARFLARPVMSRLMRWFLPGPLVRNAVSGCLFPVLAELGVFSYRVTVLERPG